MSEDQASDVGDPTIDDSPPAESDRSLDLPGPRRFAVYVLLPAAIGTVVYWVFTDATLLETGIFGAVMVVMIMAMDYLFDTIPSA